MKLELNVSWEIGEVLESIAATPKQVRQATRRALSRTARHMQTVVRREAAKEAKVPQKAIRGRFYRHLSRSRDAASIWAGTYHVPLSQLGEPRQTKAGVRVGRLFYPGAFVGRGKLEGRGVFIRYRSRHFDPALYRTPKHSPSADPIVRALGIPLDRAVDRAFTGNEASFEQFFISAFRGELARAMEGKR